MQVSVWLLLWNWAGDGFARLRGVAPDPTAGPAQLSRRTLAIISVVSTALCLVSVAAVIVLAFRVEALAGKPRPVAVASRAWLSPISIHIEPAPLRSDGKTRVDVTLDYANVGLEPAHGVVVKMRSGTVLEAVSSATLDAIYAGENATCDSLITPDKGGIVLPSSTAVRSYSQTDIMANADMVEHLQGVLVVQACIKYQTADGAIRTTKLCQYVEPETDRPLDERRLRACADGNEAN